MTKTLLLPALAAACIGALVSSGGAHAAIPGPSSTLVRTDTTVDQVRVMRSHRMVKTKRGRSIGSKKGL